MRSFCKSPRSGNYKSLPKLYSINFSCDCVVIALSATWCGECTARKSRYSCKLKRTILCSYIFCYAWMDMPYICTYVCMSSMFNTMQSLPSFSCSAVAFVTNFIGVKKAETPQLFGLPQSRDVILIAVRPDCAVSAPLPLLFVSLPLLSASHYLPSFCSRCRRCRIVDGASNQISAHFHFRSSFTLIPSWGLPLPPLLRNYKFSCYIITVSLALPRSIR